ncbi:hypothetical protein BKA67DRAFT_551468 [Truncatella angustata]|uniref:Uncharacterized protein n=1 Tax=Truncatella angustata TaxID=152316 RepID=A0A9P8ZZR0_9PEZI|nr:uncharacterized protein BKA67DRAFT_551468 [Truncatella angustata]KAH6656284.1 hypothetical protein BKA67DRAFT_551468 [Truncatella angustata]KAH8202150.1 hypothetical protein TruAng_003728 [Truncatella angustata]
MVALSLIKSSNSRLSSAISNQLVSVFVGATSGIGEATLKKFAFYTHRPRAYFIGRSQDAADRILVECKSLNPDGEYIFIKADISLIRVVDQVCREIEAKEKQINILFLSSGIPSFDRTETTEGLHLLAALNYYSRLRFVTNLLPLLQQAINLRRVVSVGGGTLEGPLDASDFQALRVPASELRGHLSTLITLGLEAVAKEATSVSFVHDYPGTVDTPFLRYMSEEMLRSYVLLPVDESGERHLYLATSARFPPAMIDGHDDVVSLEDDAAVALGTTGEAGGGVYIVGPDCEGPTSLVRDFLGEMRKSGLVKEVWRHTVGEFDRIVGDLR